MAITVTLELLPEKLNDFLPEERLAAKRLLELSKNSSQRIYEFDHYRQANQPITKLRIRSGQHWTAEDFEALTELRHVRELEIGNIPLSKKALQILAAMPKLESLQIKEERALSMDLFEPFAGHPKLSSFYFESAQADERCFEIVATWPSLERIQNWYFPFSNVTCFAFAKNAKTLTNFRGFSVGNSTIDDEGFAALATLPALMSIHVTTSAIRGSGATAFHSHPTFFALTLIDSKIDDAGIVAFSGIKQLQYLRLNGNPISDVGIAKLAALGGIPKLKVLSLAKTKITGTSLAKLNVFKKLKDLDLGDCKLIPKIVPILGKCASLKHVSVSQKYFSKDQKTALKLLLPKCTIQICDSDDEEADEDEGPWNDPQYFWKNPPACLTGFKLTKKRSKDLGESNVRFALSCSCGNGKGAVSGYPLSTCDQKKKKAAKSGELFVSPLKFVCSKCEKTTPILDTDEHGYNAQLGSSSTIRGVGKAEHCLCEKCGTAQWKLQAGIVHGDEAHEVWLEDPEVQLENYFDWFTLKGTCAKCKHEQTIADFECA